MNCLLTAWHEHQAELRGWLRHRLGNTVDAEDLLQDVFLKALRQGERFCAITNARAWLYEVARDQGAETKESAPEEFPGQRCFASFPVKWHPPQSIVVRLFSS